MENKVRQSSDQNGSSSSEIRSAIEGLSMMVKANNKPSHVVLVVKVENSNSHDHSDDRARDNHDVALLQIPTKPFLSLCNNLVLQVLGN